MRSDGAEWWWLERVCLSDRSLELSLAIIINRISIVAILVFRRFTHLRIACIPCMGICSVQTCLQVFNRLTGGFAIKLHTCVRESTLGLKALVVQTVE